MDPQGVEAHRVGTVTLGYPSEERVLVQRCGACGGGGRLSSWRPASTTQWVKASPAYTVKLQG